jgi:hypothetical protein
MSWFTPILLTHDERGALASLAADSARFGAGPGSGIGSGGGLGSARASSQWAWSVAPAQPPAQMTPSAVTRAAIAHEGACLRAPVELLSRMSEAARVSSRSESEVWVEAAREWLRRREGEPGAPPAAPTAPPAPTVAPRRATRLWDDIDALLIELRAPAAALPDCAGAPAA